MMSLTLSLQVVIGSICLTLEAGVGHVTVPMLLAKSSFHGNVKNWSTLINLHSELSLEVKHTSTDVYTQYEPKYNIRQVPLIFTYQISRTHSLIGLIFSVMCFSFRFTITMR